METTSATSEASLEEVTKSNGNASKTSLPIEQKNLLCTVVLYNRGYLLKFLDFSIGKISYG